MSVFIFSKKIYADEEIPVYGNGSQKRDSTYADVLTTWADIEKAEQLLFWKPEINIEEGIKTTVQWLFEFPISHQL